MENVCTDPIICMMAKDRAEQQAARATAKAQADRDARIAARGAQQAQIKRKARRSVISRVATEIGSCAVLGLLAVAAEQNGIINWDLMASILMVVAGYSCFRAGQASVEVRRWR